MALKDIGSIVHAAVADSPTLVRVIVAILFLYPIADNVWSKYSRSGQLDDIYRQEHQILRDIAIQTRGLITDSNWYNYRICKNTSETESEKSLCRPPKGKADDP